MCHCCLLLSRVPFQGDVGPFQPQRPVQVPLWLAITLKTRHKCTIRPPDWLSKGTVPAGAGREVPAGTLAQPPRSLPARPPRFPRLAALTLKLEEERSTSSFVEMPPQFLEISALLLQ